MQSLENKLRNRHSKACRSNLFQKGRYSSHGTRKKLAEESRIHKPPLSSISNYKRGSLSNTPLIKLEEQKHRKLEIFNSTVKQDNMNSNLRSLFTQAPNEFSYKKKKPYYQKRNATNYTRKNKFGNLKRKYKKHHVRKGKPNLQFHNLLYFLFSNDLYYGPNPYSFHDGS